MSYTTFTTSGPIYQKPMQPSFSIYEPGTSLKVPSLIHCFLEEIELDRDNLPGQICAKDGRIYSCVYESRIPADMRKIPTLISFQRHKHGCFAIIRVKNK